MKIASFDAGWEYVDRSSTVLPLTSRLGNLLGRTVGSMFRSS